MKIMSLCVITFLLYIEHNINYNIPCLLLTLEECGHLLDIFVAQQFQGRTICFWNMLELLTLN